jgi:hypothetical protein
MKIDRVILTSNTDKTYYEFWNQLSYTYKEKFGITPTLVFFGTEEEFTNLGLSKKYGDVFFEQSINDVGNWQYTWALFYYTKFFPNETCVLMGIDQIPLGTYFIRDIIENVNENNYVMLTDDHYVKTNQTAHDWSLGGFSPSAYHISKGSVFNEIYKFEDLFESEILKIKNLNVKTMWENGWGTDEGYSSSVLYNYEKKEIIKCFSKSEELVRRRIECFRSYEPNYDINLLQNNHYIECHSCRPYSNHKNYLDTLFNNIPKYI